MRYRIPLWILLVALPSCALFHKFGVKRNGRDEGNITAKLITAIPFKEFTGGVLVLRAALDSLPDSLNFILDTGSGGISLDSTTCAKYGIKVEASDRYIRGIGGIRRLFFAKDKTLLLPGLRVDSLNFHISNYAFISSVYGEKIDGIIGYSFLKDYIVQVNYDSMKLYVYHPGHFTYSKVGQLLKPLIQNIPVIPSVTYNRKAVDTHLYFDMGAGLCLMLSNRFMEDSCLFCTPKQRRHKFIKTEAQGLIGKIEMTQTVLEGYRIGKYYFRKVPVYLFDDVSNVTNYPSLGGLVGNDLLRRFNVTLNYPKNEIYISPNKTFGDPFDYSYTGLVMYFIDGHVEVTEIIKDSPAEKAGFKEGDRIMAINNNFSNNIQAYREQLKATGSKVNVIVMRDGQVIEIKLGIKSIL